MTAPAVVVVGGSIAGLATALALAERGFAVRVLERSAPPPQGPAGKAAELWHRPTVAQSDHSHILTSLGVRVLRRSAPHLLATALEEGARLLDLTRAAPARADRRGAADRAVASRGTPYATAAAPRADPPAGKAGRTGRPERPCDVNPGELVALAIRRPVLELLLHRAVSALPQVTIDHGITVRGLLLDPAGARARGVLTDTGGQVPARFVVDATGRPAAAQSWLRNAGLPMGDDLTAPTHLRCFTRFYRLTEPDGPPPGPLNRGNAAGGIWDHYAAVVHPADNGTFAITLGTLTADPATTALRESAAFTAAARLSPHVTRWTDERAATPLTGVRAITMPPNILRSAIRPGRRQVTGLFPVGDAACVTDPLYGRGMSLALEHAFRLAEVLDAHPAVGERQSDLAVGLADRIHRPWYEQAVHDSRARSGLWRARADGTAPPAVAAAAPGRPALAELAQAAAADVTVWRGLVRVLMGLDTPAEVFDAADFQDRVRDAPRGFAPTGPRPPTRQELLAALDAGAQ